MSNEKRAPGCLGYIGDEKTTQLCGDYFISHYKDPGSLLNNQYFMESLRPVFLTVDHVGLINSWFCCGTVDGSEIRRSPPDVYETLQRMGHLPYQLVSRISGPSTVWG